MSKHIDLVADVGPEGVRTQGARRHLESCADCRRRVAALTRLARLYAGMGRAGETVAPSSSRGKCLSMEQLLALAAPGASPPSTALRTHLEACPECSLALEEASLAMNPQAVSGRLGVRIEPLPRHVRAHVRAQGPALPLAAIPRNITRPSGTRKKATPRRRRKKRTG